MYDKNVQKNLTEDFQNQKLKASYCWGGGITHRYKYNQLNNK